MTARIGITMGDPAGVGPEVICRALADMSSAELGAITVYGDRSRLAEAAAIVGTSLDLDGPQGMKLVEIPFEGTPVPFGKVDARAGDLAFRCIRKATEEAQAGLIDCMVTAPINKESLNLAGHHYDGHTGMLAALTGARASFMVLASERLKVIHVSTHVALRTAIERATTARVLDTIRAGHGHLRRIGIERPRIAVAGLNPHCGENGLFGTEDDEHIRPAVEAARNEGIDVVGPVAADTVYFRCYSGEYDLVVAQYHDQGHIPMKLVAFDTTVNVSVGLPIDRTSVDHGTAFDIAGTGKARHINMHAAIAYARLLAGTASERN